MIVANSYQVGGNHYNNAAGYAHWDFCVAVPLSYLEGQATKYVVRWRKKNGVQDLEKALHYLNKLEETGATSPRRISLAEQVAQSDRFAVINGLSPMEQAFVEALTTWDGESPHNLWHARAYLFALMEEAQGYDQEAQARAAAKPVPLTEENHYSERVNVG